MSGTPVNPIIQKEKETGIYTKEFGLTVKNSDGTVSGSNSIENELIDKIIAGIERFVTNKIEEGAAKNAYYGSEAIDPNQFSIIKGSKRVIRLNGILGMKSLYIGKKTNKSFFTKGPYRRGKTVLFQINEDGKQGQELETIDLESENSTNTFIKKYVKDKPEFYIAIVRSLTQDKIIREDKRLLMATLELAMEMGDNGTTALVADNAIKIEDIGKTPKPITENSGTGETGSGTGSGTSTTSSIALVGLGVLAIGLLMSNTNDKKE